LPLLKFQPSYIVFLEEDVDLRVVSGMSGVTSESVRRHALVIP